MRKRAPLVAVIAGCSLVVLLAGTACTPQTAQEPAASEDQQQEQVIQDETSSQAETEPTDGTTDSATEANPNRDPANPPYATVTATDNPDNVAYPMTCSATWSFVQDGETMTVTTDAPHPVQYAADGMPALSVDEPTEVAVSFDAAPATYADATRYLESDISEAASAAGSVHDLSASDVIGEIIDAQVADGAVTLTVEPGYRYALEVSFEDGIAMYVFTVNAA